MKKYLGALGAILLFGMLFSAIYYFSPVQPATAAPVEVVLEAPAFAPTPVAGVTRGSKGGALATFYNAKSITADEVSTCLETLGFDVMDLHWWIDQGGASNNNTTTLTLLYTNDRTITNTLYDVGPTIVTSNTADSSDMQQFAVFGRYTCIKANVTSSEDVTVSVKTVVK